MTTGAPSSLASYVWAGLAVFGAGTIAFLAYYWGLVPPTIVEKGTVNVPGDTITAHTRRVYVGGRGVGGSFWQVELSNGSWIDCGSNCAETFRKDFDSRSSHHIRD
jgi:hypothetical protein